MAGDDDGRFHIHVDGRRIAVRAGQSIAAALLQNGIVALRTTRRGKPRGLFCGIGMCFDCIVDLDGRRGVRACLEPVRDGMSIALRNEAADATG